MGKIIFAGAGPGDPELISVKALKALQCANVILYDALVNPSLLKHVPFSCKHIYVGKRRGKKEFEQEEINSLLVFYARRYDVVVRLKGGDPNVFGRGHEEMSYVRQHGILTEMIPGISSAIAAPAAADIPLTKRGVNESFWVVTGTLSSGELANDFELAARSSATVVVLMGVSHLKTISSLVARLRSPDEPMALIQDATMSEQKVVTGTASEIFANATSAGISSPAVIVIGKVVEERYTLHRIIKQTQVNIY
jgi:uroporphyrin-III C-methyltransferase